VPVTAATPDERPGRFSAHFRERYLESLGYYKHFYDDVALYGDERAAERMLYFVPGINGTPGQIRFLFPSFARLYGQDFAVKALYLPEFGARRPIWEKYTLENVDKKRVQIIADLKELLKRRERVTVLCSSNGFYDFVSALCAWGDRDASSRLDLVWGPCAPDWFIETFWEKVFYPLNGFTVNGWRWFAYPNHNLLKALNPETTTRFAWRHGRQGKVFFKNDLESRFIATGLQWDYISFGCFNAMLRHVLAGVTGPLSIKARVLVPMQDGFWQGRGVGEIRKVLDKYLTSYDVVYKNASHLWVVAPENVTETMAPLQLAG
jgi:hypothetical protein